MKSGFGKIVCYVLTAIFALMIVGGAAAIIVKARDAFAPIGGGDRTVIGFTGMQNEDSTLTWTHDIAQYNGEAAFETHENPAAKPDATHIVAVTSKLDEIFPYKLIREVKDQYGNAFIEFPKLYMSYELDAAGNIEGVNFANYKAGNNYFIPDAYKDAEGKITDAFYIGKYEGYVSAGELVSKTQYQPTGNLTRSECRDLARAYNAKEGNGGYYQQLDISMWTVYQLLTACYLRTMDIQSVNPGIVGQGDALDGPMATGGTEFIKNLTGWQTNTNVNKFLGVENPAGNMASWVDGIRFEQDHIFYIADPDEFSDVEGGVDLGFARPLSTGVIRALRPGTGDKAHSVIFPALLDDTDWSADELKLNYTADIYSVYNYSGGKTMYVGGCWTGEAFEAAVYGLFSSASGLTETGVFPEVGARLCARSIQEAKA